MNTMANERPVLLSVAQDVAHQVVSKNWAGPALAKGEKAECGDHGNEHREDATWSKSWRERQRAVYLG